MNQTLTQLPADQKPETLSGEQIPLGIEYAPLKVRRYGLADAHTYPLVSRGKRPNGGFSSFRVPAAEAWAYPEIELLRSGNSYAALGFDVDGANALERVLWEVEKGRILEPCWTVTRRDGGGTHVVFCLLKQVYRGPHTRAAPLRKLARISEYYAQVLDADAGYSGVLTHNPMAAGHGPELVTNWMHRGGYALDQLAKVIPFGWRKPTIPKTAIGRNCMLFDAGAKWAGSPKNINVPVLAALLAINPEVAEALGKDPLHQSEVAGIARSIERKRAEWIADGKFYTPEQRSAWGRERGKRGGKASVEVRRKGTPLEGDPKPWKRMGISRATWYRWR